MCPLNNPLSESIIEWGGRIPATNPDANYLYRSRSETDVNTTQNLSKMYQCARKGRLVRFRADLSSVPDVSIDVNLYKNGSSVANITISTSISNISSDLSLSVASGDYLEVKADAGGVGLAALKLIGVTLEYVHE